MKSFKQLREDVSKDLEPDYTGIHYSHKSGLSHLSGDMSGTGIRGAEQNRLDLTKDKRIKKRVYFYPKKSDTTLPRPEGGLGVHVYEAKLNNMYHPHTIDENSKKVIAATEKYKNEGEHPSNAFERAVLDSGYHGYHTPTMSVVLNRSVPVKYKGTSIGKTFHEHTKGSPEVKSVFDAQPNRQGEHESPMLTPEQSMFYQKHKDRLKTAAPSTRMEYGRIVVHKDDKDKLKNELGKQGNHPF